MERDEVPYWQLAQKRLKQVLGEADWTKMVEAVVHAAEAIQFRAEG